MSRLEMLRGAWPGTAWAVPLRTTRPDLIRADGGRTPYGERVLARWVALCEGPGKVWEGCYPPGVCACGRTGATLCCTEATYNDGSTDNPTCTECCPGRPHRLPHGWRDRTYSPD